MTLDVYSVNSTTLFCYNVSTMVDVEYKSQAFLRFLNLSFALSAQCLSRDNPYRGNHESQSNYCQGLYYQIFGDGKIL